MNPNEIREACDLLERGMRKLSSGPLDYYLRKLSECYDLLLDRFAPFKAGDRVVLTETPPIEKDSGWYHSRHFLVKGEAGTVHSVECSGKGFSASVEFDNETWIPDQDFAGQGIVKGVPQPVQSKYTYHFGERWLVKVPRTTE